VLPLFPDEATATVPIAPPPTSTAAAIPIRAFMLVRRLLLVIEAS
jgi:hypothetical protein